METLKAIEERKSIRKYKPDAIPESHLKRILRAARLAPSAGNFQPWRFIIIREPKLKKKVAELSINFRGKMQMFIADADVLVVALGDDENSEGRYEKWVDLDPMIAIEHLVLAATSMGYGTCWIGAFEEYRLKQVLSIPDRVKVIALLPIGVPDQVPELKSRKPFGEIFFEEKYGVPLEL